jgi:hypothetical protein
MKKQVDKNKVSSPKVERKEEQDLPGYPLYPASEDVYANFEKVDNIDLDDMSKVRKKSKKNNPDANNEKDFEDDVSGDDLDIPGSELDDDQEELGSEDEENNYYSLGDTD